MSIRQIGTIEHMTCQCGRNPSLMLHSEGGKTYYTAEAYCCKTITVPLQTQQAAANEFQRLRAVQTNDPAVWPANTTQIIRFAGERK